MRGVGAKKRLFEGPRRTGSGSLGVPKDFCNGQRFEGYTKLSQKVRNFPQKCTVEGLGRRGEWRGFRRRLSGVVHEALEMKD